MLTKILRRLDRSGNPFCRYWYQAIGFRVRRRLYYWVPSRGGGHSVRTNFGDELSKVVVEHIGGNRVKKAPERWSKKLLAVGSIILLARPGDLVWGSGVNGKVTVEDGSPALPKNLDKIKFLAVRGPKTRDLIRAHGGHCPAIYGDPALLLPRVVPGGSQVRRGIVLIPHFSDISRAQCLQEVLTGKVSLVLPDSPLARIVEAVCNAELVVSSSLHGLILSDAYGVGSRMIRLGQEESLFKFEDYYLGTGRSLPTIASSVSDAVSLGPVEQMTWDPTPLLDAYPHH